MPTINFRKSRGKTDTALALAQEFFAEHGAALCKASELLGGSSAERRCLALLLSLAEDRALRGKHIQDLIETHRLLTLQHVGNPDRIETALFACIDPLDPRVHDLCLLADRLLNLLSEIADVQGHDDAPAELIDHIAA